MKLDEKHKKTLILVGALASIAAVVYLVLRNAKPAAGEANTVYVRGGGGASGGGGFVSVPNQSGPLGLGLPELRQPNTGNLPGTYPGAVWNSPIGTVKVGPLPGKIHPPENPPTTTPPVGVPPSTTPPANPPPATNPPPVGGPIGRPPEGPPLPHFNAAAGDEYADAWSSRNGGTLDALARNRGDMGQRDAMPAYGVRARAGNKVEL